MAENPNSRPVITTESSPYLECGNSSTGTPWYDKESVQNVSEYLIFVEVVSTLQNYNKTYIRIKWAGEEENQQLVVKTFGYW